MLPDFIPRNHPAGAHCQKLQQRQLAHRQIDSLARPSHCAGVAVDFQIGHANDRRLAVVFSPHQRGNARQQFFKSEGFDKIIVGAEVQSTNPVSQLIFGSQHEDVSLFSLFAQLFENCPTISFRQHDVEDDRIVFTGLGVTGLPVHRLPHRLNSPLPAGRGQARFARGGSLQSREFAWH